MFINKAGAIFRPAQPIPAEHRANFNHLFAEIFWFGLLSGSIMSFLVIYATRQGASAGQIGLINAIPAVVTLIFAMPISALIGKRSLHQTVFWSALIMRAFYLLLLPLPVLFSSPTQVWAIIGITLAMSIPGTGVAIGFNVLFAEAVPTEWRGYVSGIRNAIVAFSATLTTLICGYLLTHIPFPMGYQVVFAIGVIGALLSAMHLSKIHPIPEFQSVEKVVKQKHVQQNLAGLNGFVHRYLSGFRIDILRGPFGLTMLLLFLFHLGQNLAIPIFPLFTVNTLHFSDQILSYGSGLFNMTTFLGSMRLDWMVRRLGNKRLMGSGVMMLGLYPALISLSRGYPLYFVASLVGGFAWAVAGGVLFNYILDKVPSNDRPGYLAWYALALNAAILLGSLVGPAISDWIGVTEALMIFAGVRMMAGAAILRWG